jgi:hypothetical protein
LQLVLDMFEAPGFRTPTTRFVSTDALREASSHDLGAGSLVSPAVRSALTSLGLLVPAEPAAAHGVSDEQGIYRHRTHEILVSLPESERGTIAANVLLVHELIHSVQASRGLVVHREGSLDERLAWRARIEGEAVVGSQRVKATLEGLEPKAIDWRGVYTRWSTASLAHIARARSPLAVAVASVPYARGALWYVTHEATTATWPEAFSVLLRDPIAVHPPASFVADLPGCTGERNMLGGLSLLAFLRSAPTEDQARNAAAALEADMLCVQPDGSFVWHLVWGKASDAAHVASVAARAKELGLRLAPRHSPPRGPDVRLTLAGPPR